MSKFLLILSTVAYIMFSFLVFFLPDTEVVLLLALMQVSTISGIAALYVKK
jgi:hypothetical protein